MSTEESKKLINLGVVLNKDGEALIIKRKNQEEGRDGARLVWAFPGGKQKGEETREECVEREILAETGYHVKSIRQISIRPHPQFPTIVIYHLCELENNQPTDTPVEQHEIEEIKWVKKDELRSYFTTDLDEKVAKELGISL